MTDAIGQFRAALAAHGIIPPDEIIGDGAIHRCSAEGKPGRKGAVYALYLDGNIPAGWFQNHHDGQGAKTWRADIGRKPSKAEEAEYRKRVAAMSAEREAEEKRLHEEAALAARLIWSDSYTSGEHAYLVRKGVGLHGARIIHAESALKDTGREKERSFMPGGLSGPLLAVPMRDAAGRLWSVQFIGEGGEKRFLKCGRKAGCYFPIGGKPEGDAPVMCVAEGFATGASVHDATGHPVAVAFDCGNLKAVAMALRVKLPDARIVLCADDDYRTAGNPGIAKATEAANEVGGTVAVPVFGDGRAEGATDFNDLHAAQGLEAVKRCIDETLAGDGEAGRESESESECAGEAAYPKETDEQAIARLAALPAFDYDRARKKEAKHLGVKESTLDEQVRAKRAEGKADGGIALREHEPWGEPVDGAALLHEVSDAIRRHVVCNQETAYAAALWAAMTWLIDEVQIAPLAVITAPEKRCGKSVMLSAIGKLSKRPLLASNITPAAMFRVIEACAPTLIVDEADAFMKENEELRGILNSGHTLDSAYVIRTVGDEHVPRQFSTWGAKAIAGIGKLADTLMDRAIVLELRRKTPSEHVIRLRHAEPGLFDALASKLCRFALDNAEAVRHARPELPDGLHDRAQDNWEPLLSIADAAGGDWPLLARKAAIAISGDDEGYLSIGNELLADIKEVFEEKRIDRASMADLIKALCEDEEKPWATYWHGKPITARQMSRRLRGYGIAPKPLRLGNYEVSKGYMREQFDDAFKRYISPSPPENPVTRLQETPEPRSGAGSGHVTGKNSFGYVTGNPVTGLQAGDEKCNRVTRIEKCNQSEQHIVTPEPAPLLGCNRVTDEMGVAGDIYIEVNV
jgi:putative DNA primase/helicase